MISWHFVTREMYDAASVASKTNDKLFFLSDTGEIYRGTQLFTESVILYTEEPTVKAVGKLYVNSITLEGKVWTGTDWYTVIQPVQTALDATNTALPVSGKAVAEYVNARLEEVTGSAALVKKLAYTSATNTITVTMADDTTESIPMDNVAADLVYDKTTGLLQVKNAAGTTIGTGINIDLERFVSKAEYDAENKKIILSFNDDGDPLEIDVGSLVDTYTAGNSSTVSMTVTGNQFTAEVIVASTEGNLLQKTENGLYVAPVDLSGKVDKVSGAVANDVALLTAEGGLSDSKVTIGGATLAGASASVLATEAAVAAIRTALQSAIDGKMAKVETGKEGEILTADAEGNAVASGIKVGGESMAASPDAATAATEKAVSGYAVAKSSIVASGSMAATVGAASDEKVVSEKAIMDALSWKTVVY